MQTPSPANSGQSPADAALAQLCQAASRALDDNNSNQFRSPAGTEPAQIAIENIATFNHTPRLRSPTKEHPEQTWFGHACGIKSGSMGICVNAEKISITTTIDGRNGLSGFINNTLNADTAEEIARRLIDAAHCLRQQISQGGAA